jgi:hypothetical protein
MLTKEKIIKWLREKIPLRFWTIVWWFIPLSAIFLLPLGIIFTFILGKIGFEGIGRLTQLLILFSIFYGFVSGIIVIWMVDSAKLSLTASSKIKWLARFGVVTPLLTVLTLFLIFSR